ncbi:MAG: protocatechuate 3,4-dioxygenase subunit alpha [Acidimicrobiales bacterium]
MPTPSQTAGPFVDIGLSWYTAGAAEPGSTRISGAVLDGNGQPVTDAVVECWQADAAGSYEGGGSWNGFSRALTLSGGYEITTVKPGAVTIDGAIEAPHLAVSIVARGLLQRLVTYVYFDDEPTANEADPLLSALEEGTRMRLVAASVPEGYRFDIVLQGEEETPFFVP